MTAYACTTTDPLFPLLSVVSLLCALHLTQVVSTLFSQRLRYWPASQYSIALKHSEIVKQPIKETKINKSLPEPCQVVVGLSSFWYEYLGIDGPSLMASFLTIISLLVLDMEPTMLVLLPSKLWSHWSNKDHPSWWQLQNPVQQASAGQIREREDKESQNKRTWWHGTCFRLENKKQQSTPKTGGPNEVRISPRNNETTVAGDANYQPRHTSLDPEKNTDISQAEQIAQAQ